MCRFAYSFMIKFKYTTKFTLANETKVIDWLNTIAKSEGYKIKKIFYNYISETKIKHLNKRHLSHNYSTDILTFDYSQGNGIVSEIYIAPKKVEKNAKKYSQSIENEMLRVISHGLLHLCGYNDTTNDEAQEMRLKEEHYLKLFHSYSK